jgi:hypothetical protein
MRFVGLDVHRDFCEIEIAIVDQGRVRSAGRVSTAPEALELFAGSLEPDDQVVLDATTTRWRSRGCCAHEPARQQLGQRAGIELVGFCRTRLMHRAGVGQHHARHMRARYKATILLQNVTMRERLCHR